jgi:hypothetical protein
VASAASQPTPSSRGILRSQGPTPTHVLPDVRPRKRGEGWRGGGGAWGWQVDKGLILIKCSLAVYLLFS